MKYFKKYNQDTKDKEYNIDYIEVGNDSKDTSPYTYVKVEYDNYISKDLPNEEYPCMECRFICKRSQKLVDKYPDKKDEDKRLGIIPSVLNDLLQERIRTKKLLKSEKDLFKKKILDGRQLALKLTANSIYGQLGARTSPIFFQEIAASCTAVGRFRINDAVKGLTQWAKEYIERDEVTWEKFINDKDEDLKYDDLKYKGDPIKLDFDKSINVIYGDTDSVFVKFDTKKHDGTDERYKGKLAVKRCIKLGIDAEKWMDLNNLKGTGQCLEYEKTFYPLILISKKRYVGNKYEMDPDKCYRDSNGIVLKRRDNAPIVKHIFGNVIEKIITDKNIDDAKRFLIETLQTLDKPLKFPINNFVISKTLRGYYKCPPAHKILANRMAERDPGTAPKSNDRIPYIYTKLPNNRLWRLKKGYKRHDKKGVLKTEPLPYVSNKEIKQGDKIEHIDYYLNSLKDTNNITPLKIDYKFYITNQIMNSVIQVLGLPCFRTDISEETEISKMTGAEIFTEAAGYYHKEYKYDPHITLN